MSMLQKDLEDMLGTKEEFERSREANGDRATCQECHHEFRMVHNEDERNLENIQLIEEFGKCSNCYDEDEEDLLGDKLRAEYQDNMRDDLFDEIATDALLEAGLTEDETERELEDFKN